MDSPADGADAPTLEHRRLSAECDLPFDIVVDSDNCPRPGINRTSRGGLRPYDLALQEQMALGSPRHEAELLISPPFDPPVVVTLRKGAREQKLSETAADVAVDTADGSGVGYGKFDGTRYEFSSHGMSGETHAPPARSLMHEYVGLAMNLAQARRGTSDAYRAKIMRSVVSLEARLQQVEPCEILVPAER